MCALEANQLEVAEAHLRGAIRLNADFAPAMLHMAELKLKSGDAVLAEAYYSRYLSLSRQTPSSLVVGYNIRRELGDQEAAEKFAQQLMTAYPQSAQAKTFLASQ